MFSRPGKGLWLWSLLFVSAVVLAASYTVDVASNGNPYQGVTDAQRANLAGSTWNAQNPYASAQAEDRLTATFQDGWSQTFEVQATQARNPDPGNPAYAMVTLASVGGTLRPPPGYSISGGSGGYTDQSGSCGGTYVEQGYFSTARYDDGTQSETWVSTGWSYQSGC